MCGIAALVYGDDAAAPADATRAVLEFATRCGLERRGPDGLDAAVPAPRVALAASVLRMRRADDWRQPVVDGRGNALAWNGEWFDGDGAPAAGAGDTAAVAAVLGAAVAGLADAADAAAAVAAVLAGRVRGPYAVAFYAADARALLFCRDPLGPGQDKRAKFPTSKAPFSAVFHSFRLIFGRAIISRNGLEAWMFLLERARAEQSR